MLANARTDTFLPLVVFVAGACMAISYFVNLPSADATQNDSAGAYQIVQQVTTHVVANGDTNSQSSFDNTRIDINSATVIELEALPGIGKKTAAAIVELRAQSGGFRRIEDIMLVKGIGKKKFDAMRERIYVKEKNKTK